MNTDRWKYSQLPQNLLHFSSCCGWNSFLMSFTSKKLFLYLVSSNLFSIPNLHSPRKLNTNWYSVNKLSLLLLIISHFSTPKIRELLFSIPNNDAAPVRRKGWGIKIQEVIPHQWKATFVSSSEPQTLLGALATDKHPHPRGRSQLPSQPRLVLCEHTHLSLRPQCCNPGSEVTTELQKSTGRSSQSPG